MRILHVIPAVAPRYGGTSAAIWPLVNALREVPGHQIELATTDADGPRRRLPSKAVPESAGIVRMFARQRSEQFKYSSQLWGWLKMHACDYDLVHVHTNWNFPVAAACRAAMRAGVPFLLSPHGMLSRYSWSRSSWKKAVYWRLVERRNVFGSAGFHVTSEEERQEVLELGVHVPIGMIPLGIDEEAFDVPVQATWLRTRCPEAGNRQVVLYLSRLHPKKGITDFLLPAFARLQSNAFLAIIGGEDAHAPGYTSMIEKEVARLGLNQRVKLLGPVPPDQRWAAFDGADVFVLPSHAENFGIVVPEAMAREKPVVVTTGVQFADHVRLSGAGTVVRADAQELAAAIDAWLCDAAARLCAGALGKAYVRDHFSWRQTAEKLVGLYQNVCTGHPCSRP
jgi:glycosyltransferase involved in cell wall biosynthesis